MIIYCYGNNIYHSSTSLAEVIMKPQCVCVCVYVSVCVCMRVCMHTNTHTYLCFK